MFFCKFIVLCVFSFDCCHGATILGVFPTIGYSHYLLGHTLMEKLSSRGHQVTMISATNINLPNISYDVIFLNGIEEAISKAFYNDGAEQRRFIKELPFKMKDAPLPLMLSYINVYGIESAEFVLNNTVVQKLLKIMQFDIVILDHWHTDALKVLCFKFKAHCIGVGMTGSSILNNYLVANPSLPSYIPEIYSDYSGKMTFMQRVSNSMIHVLLNVEKHLFYLRQQNALVQKYFPGAPDIYELNKVSLLLLNSHVATNPAIPQVPNVIEIGGSHIQEPKKMSDDLQQYMDDAKNGVIYFSLGTVFNSNKLANNSLNEIQVALSKLKMKVLWKFEDPNLPEKSDNIRIEGWLPQQDILAHPNIKLFITHGGMNSLMESTYYGIPIVGIPLCFDQSTNIAFAERNGMGITINYDELNEKLLTSAINTVLSNPEFKENAMKRSRIMRDQPIKPLDKAMFWIEYTLRHNGTDHLKSDALHLTWYQYMLLDVAIFIMAAFCIYIIILFYIFKWWHSKKIVLENKCKNKKIK